MSASKTCSKGHQRVTPPSSFVNAPLTPPPTTEKTSTQPLKIIELFKLIQRGRHTKLQPWTEYQLAPEEYEVLKHQLAQDEELEGFADDKIRYDYDPSTRQLVVRMPTGIHERFIDGVEDAIRTQLKVIRSGSDKAALFAQKIIPSRSTEIDFPVEDMHPSTNAKHEPDASFFHADAEYPGVIIEVSYSQKAKRLERLAEHYLLDSDANVQVVVGLNIEYITKKARQDPHNTNESKSCKATLSVWRTQTFHTADGDELRSVAEIEDEAFRDEEGNHTNHLGLRLRLRDFASKGLAQKEIGDDDREIVISTQQLSEFLTAAEARERQRGSLRRNPIAPGLKKRKRSDSPQERIASDDEARYVEQEEKKLSVQKRKIQSIRVP